MKQTILSIFLISVMLFFISCDSKPQEAQVISTKDISKNKTNFNPEFVLTTTKDEKIKLTVSKQAIFSKQLEGKIVLVNFWAPWCEPCKKEMPSFVKLQEKYKDDFIILGVLFDKQSTKEEVDSFLKKYKVNFPITVGEENFKLAKVFDNVKMIPESFLYTKDGIFIEKFIGEISEARLEKYILENRD